VASDEARVRLAGLVVSVIGEDARGGYVL